MPKHTPHKREGLRRMEAQERRRRIEALGGFGALRTQVVKDKKQYSRKDWKKGLEGPFAFGGAASLFKLPGHGKVICGGQGVGA